jgi:acyl-CoA thioesterase-2
VSDPADELLELLNLQSQGQGIFTGPPARESAMRVFGGQVLAQALAAASFTVEGPVCHSLHAYFVRPGKPGRPIDYEVAAMRDGQSFSLRKVVAVQRDEVNLEMVAAFQHDAASGAVGQHDDGSGEREHAAAPPDVPLPESFPDEDTRIAQMLEQAPAEHHAMLSRRRPIEAIRVDGRILGERAPTTAPVRTWMRVRGALMDDPNLHRCALAYASDMGLLEPSLRAIGASFGDSGMQVASLDHAIWFHRPFRFDDWLLFVLEADSVSAGRGLSHAKVWTRDGRHVATIAQEGLMRTRSAEAAV